MNLGDRPFRVICHKISLTNHDIRSKDTALFEMLFKFAHLRHQSCIVWGVIDYCKTKTLVATGRGGQNIAKMSHDKQEVYATSWY